MAGPTRNPLDLGFGAGSFVQRFLLAEILGPPRARSLPPAVPPPPPPPAPAERPADAPALPAGGETRGSRSE